jgi:hypothetical protein
MNAGLRLDNVSFFQVPLQCPAAPQIGCGSRAKPILLALENDSSIAEAWLNGTGASLAVVGKENSSRESRAQAVKTQLESVFEKNSASELQGEARDQELKSFLSGNGWYRGAQLDTLSEMELSDETARTFEIALIEAFKRHNIRAPGQPAPTQKSRHDDLLKVAREHLDEKGVVAFLHSIADGYRPEPHER